jgi:hypothetical protein
MPGCAEEVAAARLGVALPTEAVDVTAVLLATVRTVVARVVVRDALGRVEGGILRRVAIALLLAAAPFQVPLKPEYLIRELASAPRPGCLGVGIRRVPWLPVNTASSRRRTLQHE